MSDGEWFECNACDGRGGDLGEWDGLCLYCGGRGERWVDGPDDDYEPGVGERWFSIEQVFDDRASGSAAEPDCG